MKKFHYFLIIFILLFSSFTFAGSSQCSSSTINWLSKQAADQFYCKISDGCGGNTTGSSIWTNVSGVATYYGDVNITGNLYVNDSIILTNTTDKRTATLIVAAHNSKNKEGADYICDGVDDDIQIQAAINSLTNGGKIVFLEGDFNISSRIELFTEDIILEGQGASTNLNCLVGSDSMIALQGSNIYIRDFKFQGSTCNEALGLYGDTNNIIIKSNNFINITSIVRIPFFVGFSKRFSISENYLLNSGMLLNFVNDSTLYNNNFDKSGLATNSFIHNEIINNKFSNLSANFRSIIFSGDDNIFSNNIIIDGGDRTVQIDGSNNIFSNNLIDYCKNDCLYFHTGDNNIINNNRISNANLSAINIRSGNGNMILNNNLFNNNITITDDGLDTTIIGNFPGGASMEIQSANGQEIKMKPFGINTVTYFPLNTTFYGDVNINDTLYANQIELKSEEAGVQRLINQNCTNESAFCSIGISNDVQSSVVMAISGSQTGLQENNSGLLADGGELFLSTLRNKSIIMGTSPDGNFQNVEFSLGFNPELSSIEFLNNILIRPVQVDGGYGLIQQNLYVLDEGGFPFIRVAIDSNNNTIVPHWDQVGRNNSFSGQMNSFGLVPKSYLVFEGMPVGDEEIGVDFLFNASDYTEYCRYLQENLSLVPEGCKYFADTTGRKVPLLFGGDLEVHRSATIHEGLLVYDDFDFITRNGDDFGLLWSNVSSGGKLHIVDQRLVEANITFFSSLITNFDDVTINPFISESIAPEVGRDWASVDEIQCHQDRCGNAKGGNEKVMAFSASTTFQGGTVASNNTRLQFYITSFLSGGDTFEVEIDNNEGNVSVIYSTGVILLDQFINVSFPQEFENKSNVTTRFILNGQNNNREVWVDIISVTSEPAESIIINESYTGGKILFGEDTDTVEDCYIERDKFVNNQTQDVEDRITLNCANINLQGVVTETDVTLENQTIIGDQTITGDLYVQGEISQSGVTLNDTYVNIDGDIMTGNLIIDASINVSGEGYFYDDINLVTNQFGTSVINFGTGSGRITYGEIEDYMYFNTKNNIRMYLDDEGNLGIGEQFPVEKLDVSGSANIQYNLTVSENVSIGDTLKAKQSVSVGNGGNNIAINNQGIAMEISTGIYQVDIGDDSTPRAGYIFDGTNSIEILPVGKAMDITTTLNSRQVEIVTNNEALEATDGTYTAKLATGSNAGEFTVSGDDRYAYVASGTYGLEVYGSSSSQTTAYFYDQNGGEYCYIGANGNGAIECVNSNSAYFYGATDNYGIYADSGGQSAAVYGYDSSNGNTAELASSSNAVYGYASSGVGGYFENSNGNTVQLSDSNNAGYFYHSSSGYYAYLGTSSYAGDFIGNVNFQNGACFSDHCISDWSEVNSSGGFENPATEDLNMSNYTIQFFNTSYIQGLDNGDINVHLPAKPSTRSQKNYAQTPSDDTYIYEGSPTTNYGGNIQVEITSAISYRQNGLFKFDVSEFAIDEIINSTLRLYLADNNLDGGDSIAVNIYHLYDSYSWTEGGATWNNRPTGGTDYNNTACATKTFTNGVTGWFSWNVTKCLKADSDGDISFYVNATTISGTISIADDLEFQSKEGANDPSLEITTDIIFPDSAALNATKIITNRLQTGLIDTSSGDLNLNPESGLVYVRNDVSAATYYDRTDDFNGTKEEAYEEYMNIKSKELSDKSVVDHSSYPDQCIDNKYIDGKLVPHRNLGCVQSMEIKAHQYINQHLINKVDILEQELCNKDNTYSWCDNKI